MAMIQEATSVVVVKQLEESWEGEEEAWILIFVSGKKAKSYGIITAAKQVMVSDTLTVPEQGTAWIKYRRKKRQNGRMGD